MQHFKTSYNVFEKNIHVSTNFVQEKNKTHLETNKCILEGSLIFYPLAEFYSNSSYSETLPSNSLMSLMFLKITSLSTLYPL